MIVTEKCKHVEKLYGKERAVFHGFYERAFKNRILIIVWFSASGHPPSSNEGDSSPPIMGRESGYGTAPSRQWRTPPGSAGKG